MKKVLDSFVVGHDCHGHYLELSTGRIYIDRLYSDILPGDRIIIRLIYENEDKYEKDELSPSCSSSSL